MLETYSPPPSVIVGVLGLAVVYWLCTRRYRDRFRRAAPVPLGRQVAFYSGIALALVALASPLDTLADEYLFSAHMLQHMLLILGVAPLLLAGTPGWLLRDVLDDLAPDALRALGAPSAGRVLRVQPDLRAGPPGQRLRADAGHTAAARRRARRLHWHRYADVDARPEPGTRHCAAVPGPRSGAVPVPADDARLAGRRTAGATGYGVLRDLPAGAAHHARSARSRISNWAGC